MTINQRLEKLINALDLNAKSFSELIGVKEATTRNYIGKRASIPNAEYLERIFRSIEGLNAEWLVANKGNMFLDTKSDTMINENVAPVENARLISDLSLQERIDLPFVPIPARASFIEMAGDQASYGEFGTYPVYSPPAEIKNKRAIVFEVNGDSMEPQLKHGAKVIGVEVPEGDWCYQTGSVYAVAFDNLFVIKRIADNDLIMQNVLRLVSDNPKGGSLTVTGKQLRGMWRVIKVIDAPVE